MPEEQKKPIDVAQVSEPNTSTIPVAPETKPEMKPETKPVTIPRTIPRLPESEDIGVEIFTIKPDIKKNQ